MKLRSLLSEPLVHFVLIGAVIVALGKALAPGETPGPARETIRITRAQIDALRGSFVTVTGREPTEAELGDAVDRMVREEALVREATAMGMAVEDSVVRARLAQRMRFLGAANADAAVPTDAELDAFRVAHPEWFSSPARVTFDHVYLDAKVWGRGVDDRAAALLGTLRGLGAGADPAQYSDPFRRPNHYDDYDLDVVQRTYGSAFGELVAGAPLGEWAGPVDSVYGVHLVRVTARSPGQLLALDEVRDSVAAAWQAEARERAATAFEDGLLEKYEVVIEPGPDAGGGGR